MPRHGLSLPRQKLVVVRREVLAADNTFEMQFLVSVVGPKGVLRAKELHDGLGVAQQIGKVISANFEAFAPVLLVAALEATAMVLELVLLRNLDGVRHVNGYTDVLFVKYRGTLYSRTCWYPS